MEPYFKGWKTTDYCYYMEYATWGGGIKKLNSVMNGGHKVRVNADEWNHILRDGKPLVIDTPWSMQLGGRNQEAKFCHER
jgi:hypothetical protein